MSLPETVSRAGLRMRRMTPSGPQEEVRAAEARTRLRSSCMRALLVPSLFFFPPIGSEGYIRVTKWRPGALASPFSSSFRPGGCLFFSVLDPETHSSRVLLITKSLKALNAPDSPGGRDRRLGPARRGAGTQRDLRRLSRR